MSDHLDLSTNSGLPLSLEGGRLCVPPELGDPRPIVRTLADMRPFLAVPNAEGPVEVYWMYRGLAAPGDRPGLDQRGLRFDVTVLTPGDTGGELVKTIGHYHPRPAGGARSYPELYAVLHGRAHYLLQDGRAGRLTRAFLVEAGPGDLVIVPPNFGHVTINPGDDPLVMANWVAASFASVYRPFAARHGGCHYEFATAGPTPRIEANLSYGEPVPLTILSASAFAELGGPRLARGEPVYRLGSEHPEGLAFLTDPDRWDWGSLVGRE